MKRAARRAAFDRERHRDHHVAGIRDIGKLQAPFRSDGLERKRIEALPRFLVVAADDGEQALDDAVLGRRTFASRRARLKPAVAAEESVDDEIDKRRLE